MRNISSKPIVLDLDLVEIGGVLHNGAPYVIRFVCPVVGRNFPSNYD